MAPWRTASVSGPSCQCVPSASSKWRPTRSPTLVSSLQATVMSGRCSAQAMRSTSRVLPQPVGPFSMTGRRCAHAASNSASSSPTLR